MAKKPSLAERMQALHLGYGSIGTLYPEWLAEQEKKQPTAEEQLPLRIREMHKLYGLTPGKTCKTCKLCIIMLGSERYYSRNYHKCLLTKITHGAGTDWRISWPACGKHQDENGKPNDVGPDPETEPEDGHKN